MRRPALAFVLLAYGCAKPAPPPATHLADAPAAPPPAPPPPAEAPRPPSSAAATPEPAPSADEPPPKVKVISIGMHVAGGPFDEETKKPFLQAVEPHYADLARCWKHVTEPHAADVGVDLLIPPGGGKPAVSNPRSNVKADGFVPCVVAFFEGIEFDKPKSGGPQGVSYSVRFKPQ